MGGQVLIREGFSFKWGRPVLIKAHLVLMRAFTLTTATPC